MIETILILAIWANTLSRYDSVALTQATFTSMTACETAGQKAVDRFTTMMKTAQYVCVQK